MSIFTNPDKNINTLLQRRLLWRGDDPVQLKSKQTSISTGEQLLDQQLHCGGWPLSQLIECLPQNSFLSAGIFIPALKKLQAAFSYQGLKQRWPVILLDPPAIPYLESWAVNSHTPVWILQSETLQEKIWLAENCLQANCSLALFTWFYEGKPAEKNIPSTQVRKLQLAATRNSGLSVIFRDAKAGQQASAASLRFTATLHPTRVAKKKSENKPSRNFHPKSSLAIKILKQPNGWGGQHCLLPWYSRLQRPRLHVKDWPVYTPASDSQVFRHDRVTWVDQAHTQRYS